MTMLTICMKSPLKRVSWMMNSYLKEVEETMQMIFGERYLEDQESDDDDTQT